MVLSRATLVSGGKVLGMANQSNFCRCSSLPHNVATQGSQREEITGTNQPKAACLLLQLFLTAAENRLGADV